MTLRTELLEEIGLTKAEIKVYLALLELGSATTGPIVDKSSASSSKIYEILEKLIQKGLASYIIKSGVKYFEAAEPQRILDYVREKEKKLYEQTKKIEELLPELELKKKLSQYKSEATIYKGMKGLETAFKDVFNVLKNGDTNYVFVVGELDDRLNLFFKRQYELRAKAGIKTKTIFSEAGRKYYESRKNIPLFEGKVIGTTTSPATINIYGTKVNIRMGVSKEVICVVIDNKELADSFLEQFNILWNQRATSLEGEAGVRTVFDDMLNYKEVWFIGGNDGIKKYFPKYWEEHNTERIKRKVVWHDLIDAQLMSNLFPGQERSKISFYEYKILPPELSSPHVIAFYGDKVANIIWKEKTIVTIIEDKEIRAGYKKYFDYLWKTIQ